MEGVVEVIPSTTSLSPITHLGQISKQHPNNNRECLHEGDGKNLEEI
jgi:hypothetical protein